MSQPIQSLADPIAEFQPHPNGSRDAAIECKEWERRCAELIQERDRLREDLAKTQADRDAYLKTVYHFMCKDYICPYTEEEILSCVGAQPPLSDLIGELEREMGTAT